MKNKYWIRKAAKILIFVPIAIFAFGFVVMSLWNYTLPAVLNVSPITFWQALGILLLSKILFGGFRGGWGGGRQQRKKEMERKLSNMTPEEKEKFKQDWKNRCSRFGRPTPEGSGYTKTSASSNTPTE